MKKSILEIYALAVCFIALVCFVIALGIGVYDLIQIASPGFTLNVYEYERHQSNETFRGSPRGSQGRALQGIGPGIPIEPAERPEEEVTQQREESFQAALRSERRRGMQSLIQIMIILVIDVLVFVPHWLLARNTRAASIAS
jgi:hypothetical protein